MSCYDAFHGDADGLCALQQLHLAMPYDSILVTGPKRDVELLVRIDVQAGDHVAALDISLESNREALVRILDQGARVRYFDHHYAGVVPAHAHFEHYIDPAPDVCTSILVDRYLKGLYRPWAIAGAFGDDLTAMGFSLAFESGLDLEGAKTLQMLGLLLNYNAYGDSIADLHFHPSELAWLMRPYPDPFEFFKRSEACRKLAGYYKDDLTRAAQLKPEFESERAIAIILPDEPWARRVRGIMANQWKSANRTRALAVLSPKENGGFAVSVRAPLDRPVGADDLCRGFVSGGGRVAAAGIDHLAGSDVGRFITQLDLYFTNRTERIDRG